MDAEASSNPGRLTERTPDERPLRNLTVLVTRPPHQRQALVSLLKSAGANPVCLPGVKIRPLALTAAAQNRAMASHCLIFTSVNAVDCFFTQTGTALAQPRYLLAIGDATANALARYGWTVTHPPAIPYNSESLMKNPVFNTDNLQSVSIISGTKGRGYMQENLRNRGFKVDLYEVYSRFRPKIPARRRVSVFLKPRPDIITITSNETLENLVSIAGRPAQTASYLQLLKTPLVVTSDRCAQLAASIGFTSRVLVTQTMGDEEILEMVQHWNDSYRRNSL